MNIPEIKISDLRLKELMKEYDITEQELEYAGVKGVAELLSWKIFFFRKKDDLSKTVAAYFFEIADSEIEETANVLLERLGMDFRFGEEIKVTDELGEPDFFDDVLENTIRYGYVLSPDRFISIGLTNGRLSFLEVVNDEQIIQEIISVRNS